MEAARALDVEVVVGSDEIPALSPLMGARALRIDLSNPGEAADVIVHHDMAAPIDAIVAVDDQGVVAAATASARLGLRHNPTAAAVATRDKQVMRELLSREEVMQPAFEPIPRDATDAETEALARNLGMPCVVKPTTLSGSQGVIKADTPEVVAATVRRVRRITASAGADPSSPLLLERFVPGPEVAVEGLLRGGELEVLAIFDKPDPLDGPYFEETIYVTPTRLSSDDERTVVDTTRKAAAALGLREGPVHAELRLNEKRAYVIEVAARTIGGLCSRALSFSTGRSLEEIVLAHAVGSPLGPLAREEEASGVLMIPVPRAGRLVSVEGLPEVRALPGVTDVQTTIARGREVRPLPEGNRYLGFVFARGDSPEEVEAVLRRAMKIVDVRIAEEGSARSIEEGAGDGDG